MSSNREGPVRLSNSCCFFLKITSGVICSSNTEKPQNQSVKMSGQMDREGFEKAMHKGITRTGFLLVKRKINFCKMIKTLIYKKKNYLTFFVSPSISCLYQSQMCLFQVLYYAGAFVHLSLPLKGFINLHCLYAVPWHQWLLTTSLCLHLEEYTASQNQSFSALVFLFFGWGIHVLFKVSLIRTES
jgi:hypothetical protein